MSVLCPPTAPETGAAGIGSDRGRWSITAMVRFMGLVVIDAMVDWQHGGAEKSKTTIMVRQEPTQTHQPPRMKTFRLAAWAAHWTGRTNAQAAASAPPEPVTAASSSPWADAGSNAQDGVDPQAPTGPTPNASEQQLELAEKRAQFWSSAAHDLCQPAQALALFLERLKRLPMDPQAAPIVGYLDSSMQDLTHLLNGVVEVAQLDAGSVSVHGAPVSVDEVVERLVAHLAPAAAHKGLRLRWRSSGQWVWTDAALLERILTILGDNAMTYTQRGAVLVTSRRVAQGRAVRIDVHDSGVGMATKQQDFIFEPFVRPRQANRPWPGFGLYLAQRLAQLLGTTLVVRSILGRGSRFSIALACMAESDRADFASCPLGLSLHTLKGVRVALVGDDPVERDRLAALLASWGCTIWSESDASAPGGDLSDGPTAPQAIVCVDPGGGAQSAGFQAAIELRRRLHADIPACLAVGDTSTAWARDTRALGFVLLESPAQAAPLRAFLRRILRV